MLTLLEEATGAVHRLGGVGRLIPNPHLLIGPHLRLEAVLSSRIEGTKTDVGQLLRFEAGQIPPPDGADDTREVQNYVTAMEHGSRRVRDGFPVLTSRRFRHSLPTRTSPGGRHMPQYILVSTLTPQGRETLHANPDRVLGVNEEVESFGCRIIAQYAVLGQYDFLTVVEAPDSETVAHMSVDLGSRGTVNIMAMPALDVDAFRAKLKESKQLAAKPVIGGEAAPEAETTETPANEN